MADDPNKRGEPDRSRINLSEDTGSTIPTDCCVDRLNPQPEAAARAVLENSV